MVPILFIIVICTILLCIIKLIELSIQFLQFNNIKTDESFDPTDYDGDLEATLNTDEEDERETSPVHNSEASTPPTLPMRPCYEVYVCKQTFNLSWIAKL